MNKNNKKQPTILIINAGSSSIKYGLYDAADLTRLKKEKREELKTAAEYDAAFSDILRLIDQENVIGVGHRIVHGGQNFSAPQKINRATLKALQELVPLAPLHQPHNLKPVELIFHSHPKLPQIACFDTAFHRTQPPLSQRYALPRDLTDKEGIIRYGFHGTSYEYIASILADTIGKENAKGRIIIAHLGNGASMCALKEGKSVATTMGFTPLDGLMMGTRSGTVDPGVIFYLAEQKNMPLDKISHIFRKESGLKGVSAISNDMRALLENNTAEAKEAVDLFCLYAAREAAALTVELGGLDALIFTAGIGENAAPVREKIIAHLRHLGDFNVHVIATNEELMMAKHVKQELSSPAATKRKKSEPQSEPTSKPAP